MSKKPSKVPAGGAGVAGGRGERMEEKEGWKVSEGVVRRKERRVRPRAEKAERFMKRVKVWLAGGIGCFVC